MSNLKIYVMTSPLNAPIVREEKMLERRFFLYALSVMIFDFLSSKNVNVRANSFDGQLRFYAGRSGRFGYSETPKVIIGGLTASQNVANELENELETLAEKLDFRIPLRYSTNKHNLTYYKSAIEIAFDQPSVSFTGIRISYPNWPSDDSGIREYWRRGAESMALASVAVDQSLHISTLQHDFGADKRIYDYVKNELPSGSDIQIYQSTAQSPRIMQLSGLLAKCLNSPERLKSTDSAQTYNGNTHKNALVRETFRAFELNGIRGDIERDNLTLKNIDF